MDYKNGQIFRLNGTFCEKTVNEQRNVSIANVTKAPEWNPIPKKYEKIKSYLGVPVFYPDNTVFGTFCIENREEHKFTEKEIGLMESFRMMIQAHLELTITNHELERLNRRIDGLEKLMKICSKCKKIRGDDGNWHQIEEYILKKTGALFTHTYCDICGQQLIKELDDFNDEKTDLS